MKHVEEASLAASDEVVQALNKAINRLSAANRDVIVLRYLEGRPMAEVAAMLPTNENTIRQRLFRAVEKLRKHLRPGGLAVTAAGLVLASVWYRGELKAQLAERETEMVKQQARAAQQVADAAVTQAEVEQGRSALLHGEPDALAHLTEATRRGDHAPGTLFMLARAQQPAAAELARFASLAGRMWWAAFSPDGTQIVTTDDRGAQVWDGRTYQRRYALSHGHEVYEARYSRDGSKLVTVAQDAVRVWDAATGALVRELIAPRNGGKSSDYYVLALSPDDRLVAASDAKGSSVQLWDLETGVAVAQLHTEAADVPRIAFSPDGRWLATGTWLGRGVKVWDLRARKLDREFPELQTAKAEFSPDGRWLATGSHPVQLREVGSWSVKWRFDSLDSNSPWIPVAFSPKSDLLAVIVRDRDIAFLEVATGRVLASLESPDRPSLVRLRFTPDGTKLVALQKDCGLQVWDLRRLRAELAFMKLDWDLPAYPR